MKHWVNRALHRVQRELLLAESRRRLRAFVSDLQHREQVRRDSRPVIIFNASTRLENISQNAGFSLVTSLALQTADIPVIHFVCQRGLAPCVLGTIREDVQQEPPCAKCLNTSKVLFGSLDTWNFSFLPDTELEDTLADMTLDELLRFDYQDLRLGEKILPSMRWILRRHHLADNNEHRWLARRYILSAWSVYKQFSALLNEKKPRAVVLFNGMFYPEAMAREAAKNADIPVFTHEVGMLALSAFFTDGEATAYPVAIDNAFKLDTKMEKRLDDYLAERRRGDFITAGVRFWPEMKALDERLACKIDEFKQMVPIFTNVVFDTSQSHANVIFEHMFAWLDLVLGYIEKHPETLFVLRAHPDELRKGKESRETVAQWVCNHKVTERSNVVFIPSDTYISSYELVDCAKFVMVYNSTIGLEAAAAGKAVLCAGKARYTQIPTVFFPNSQNAFERMLEEFLEQKTIQIPEIFQINAKRVLYSQLYRASLPFSDFLENDGIWRGYVRLKKFTKRDLSPERSATIRVLLDGILNSHPFLLEE